MGTGVMIGAGIFALTGQVSGKPANVNSWPASMIPIMNINSTNNRKSNTRRRSTP